ncbi:hypothetical protein [Mycobacterium sp. OTB74]|uniref:hypothetical protein n=1 Tax=Mycobacterium sp. OTB74 TaxID=1853452 RepID=UPI002474A3EE|nr:hypothetical protein [Mycobacterium sp. OTB74]MDH6247547.1 hypothetical protein [Mycobacterium sp. OTB74]
MTIENNPSGGGDPTAEAANRTDTTGSHLNTGNYKSRTGGDVIADLNRRRSASCRLAPLDCGCRDPWPCRCAEPQLTDREVDAYRDAALHLRHCGLLPAPNIAAMQALWRRGDADRRLVAELAERWWVAA